MELTNGWSKVSKDTARIYYILRGNEKQRKESYDRTVGGREGVGRLFLFELLLFLLLVLSSFSVHPL